MSHELLVQMAYCIKYKFRAGFVLIYLQASESARCNLIIE